MPPENIEVKYSLTLVNADTPDSVFRPNRIAKASFGRKNKAFSDWIPDGGAEDARKTRI